jgi:hypothetical protein
LPFLEPKASRLKPALLAALLLVGPLASLAGAQQPNPPSPPASQPGAGGQPAPPPAPDLFQETLRAERAMPRENHVYDVEAVVASMFLVPGRALTCVLGGAVGFVILGATLGTAYRPASAVVHEGCGGKWIVTGDDLRPETGTGRPVEFYMEQQR